nr:hypothetical protein [Halomicroarcula pellucida]
MAFQTDPIGAVLDIAVPNAPAESARQALLDDIEHKLVGERNNLVFRSVRQAHEQLESYASTNDYHVDPLIESFAGVDVARDRTSIHAEWSWSHEAMPFWEFGTSDHTVDGDPLLVFEFDKSEYPGLAEMFPGGTAFLPQTEPTGLPESRAVRDSLNWLRREVSQ